MPTIFLIYKYCSLDYIHLLFLRKSKFSEPKDQLFHQRMRELFIQLIPDLPFAVAFKLGQPDRTVNINGKYAITERIRPGMECNRGTYYRIPDLENPTG